VRADEILTFLANEAQSQGFHEQAFFIDMARQSIKQRHSAVRARPTPRKD